MNKTIQATVAAILLVSLSGSVSASIVLTTDNRSSSGGTTDTFFDSNIVNNDLVNNGRPSLSSIAVTPGSQGFANAVGAYDGLGGSNSTNTAYFATLPATIAFTLNTSGANSPGYTLTAIHTFAGWANSKGFADQSYTVKYTKVGESLNSYLNTLTTVSYVPFNTNPLASEQSSTQVFITEDTSGILAKNVSQIEFIVSQPSNTQGTQPGWQGTVYREFDVIGSVTAVPEPTACVLVGALSISGMGMLSIRRAFRRFAVGGRG
jgi:hypothetical protein